jgi:hypothetical protein
VSTVLQTHKQDEYAHNLRILRRFTENFSLRLQFSL